MFFINRASNWSALIDPLGDVQQEQHGAGDRRQDSGNQADDRDEYHGRISTISLPDEKYCSPSRLPAP